MQRKQQLVLLRLKTVFFCGRLTEVKESPDLPSELGQITVLGAGEILLRLHYCIVSRYNIRWRRGSIPKFAEVERPR